jgi:hypothetical protein
MPQIPLYYPAGKAQYVYYGLAKALNVSLQKLDPGPPPTWVDKTNAEVKADVDVALREHLHRRIKAVYAAEDAVSKQADFEAAFVDPELGDAEP